MGATLLKNQTNGDSDVTQRVTNAYIQGLAVNIRGILEKSGAFRQHEVEAIVESVMDALAERGALEAGDLARRLHSHQFPKDFAMKLAHALT